MEITILLILIWVIISAFSTMLKLNELSKKIDELQKSIDKQPEV